MTKCLPRFLCLLLFAAAVPAGAQDAWYAGAVSGPGAAAAPPPSAPAPAAGNVLKCSACYGTLHRNYTPATAQGLKSFAAGMTAPAGYTPQEARNYFEATGRFLAGAGLDGSAAAWKAEKKRLLAIVHEGSYYFGNAILNVGSGAWDCLTHANRLKEYLEEKTPSGAEYKYEVVNGWNDPRKYSAGNLVAANHYVVRAVSLKTGHSYICDGYTGDSVEFEKDDTHIVFNEFEECVYNKYSEMRFGSGLRRVAAQWTPVQKGVMALNGKSGAGVCLSGAESWAFEK
ncbi:MAG TPA: hypothetical protein PKI19_12655 [Elusimicrobiales bacterium]|nr:hypothetical protein [Elusimicrobiales bacterium]